jgi:hypothetical protein
MTDSDKGKKVTGPQPKIKEEKVITVVIVACCDFNKE